MASITGSSEFKAGIPSITPWKSWNFPDNSFPSYNASNPYGPPAPQVSALSDMLGKMQMPDTNLTPIQAYSAKDMSQTALPQYDMARSQTTQALNAQEGSARDAMDRKFAALGGGPSGAAIAAGNVQEQELAQNRAQAMNQINMGEAGARQALQQQEAQKEFQSGESTKQFNANQALQSKQLQMGENQFQFGANAQIAGLDLGYKKMQQEAADEAFNAGMAQYQAAHTGGLLGSGGFLGLGLGG